MNKSTIITLAGLALSGIGALLSSMADDKKLEETVTKEVAKQLKKKRIK